MAEPKTVGGIKRKLCIYTQTKKIQSGIRDFLIALADIVTLFDSLALTSASVDVLESGALFMQALGQRRGLVGAGHLVSLGITDTMCDIVAGLLKGAVV